MSISPTQALIRSSSDAFPSSSLEEGSRCCRGCRRCLQWRSKRRTRTTMRTSSRSHRGVTMADPASRALGGGGQCSCCEWDVMVKLTSSSPGPRKIELPWTRVIPELASTAEWTHRRPCLLRPTLPSTSGVARSKSIALWPQDSRLSLGDAARRRLTRRRRCFYGLSSRRECTVDEAGSLCRGWRSRQGTRRTEGWSPVQLASIHSAVAS